MKKRKPLKGLHAIVTSGPTYEPLDPVRFIGNRSSGKQGHAIATSLKKAGAKVTLISGPVHLPDPRGVTVIHVETALEMFNATMNTLPADITVCAAAVADWRAVSNETKKIKKIIGKEPPAIRLKENPDILAEVSKHENRPKLVVGFAAETNDVIEQAQAKRERKFCDWILANDVSEDVFGADTNQVHLITKTTVKEWPISSKENIAKQLTNEISQWFLENIEK